MSDNPKYYDYVRVLTSTVSTSNVGGSINPFESFIFDIEIMN